MGFGLWLMSRLPADANGTTWCRALVVAGVGLELVNPRLAPVAAAAATPKQRPVLAAARASTALRQLGAATGVAVLGSVFATRLTDEISSRISAFPQLSGQGPQIAGLVLDGRTNVAVKSAPALVRPALYSVIHTSFTQTMHEVFLVAAGVALVSAILALSIRSSDVRKQGTVVDEVAIVPALAALSAGERPRAQLDPGPYALAEVQPAELTPSAVVHAEALVVDITPKEEGVTVDLATIDLASRPFPPAGPTSTEFATVMRPRDQADGRDRVNGRSETDADQSATAEDAGERLGADEEAGSDHPASLGASAAVAHPVPVSSPGAVGHRVHEEAPRDVALLGGDSRGVLELTTAGSLSVRVTRARDGSPVKAELALLSSGADVVLRHWTDGDGGLIVPDLPAGHYELVVQSLGYRPETRPVAVTESGARSVEVGLVGVGHIYGAVAGPGGGWLPGVLITLTDASGAVVATTKSDSAGSFHFTRVLEGSYTVAAPTWAAAIAAVETGPGSVVAADVEFVRSREENDVTVRPLEGGD